MQLLMFLYGDCWILSTREMFSDKVDPDELRTHNYEENMEELKIFTLAVYCLSNIKYNWKNWNEKKNQY